MSEVAARPQRRRRRRLDLLAMLAIGVVIVGAGLLPAVTANSGETTTVRGQVTLDGQPLAFFPVGFWSPSIKPVTATTDAGGRFTMDVPVTVDGFAYAGTAPNATRAIVSVGGRQVVRGIIGQKAQRGITTPTYQGWTTATARALAGGAAQLHFRLQQPGRISGTSPVPTSGLQAVQVRRLDGSVVTTLRPDSRRRFTSEPLAPGGYALVVVPKNPDLPVVTPVTVAAGRTVTVAPASPTAGTVVEGTVRTEARSLGAGVPVLLEQDGTVLASITTSASGDWAFRGVAPGDYTVEVGRYDVAAAVSASAVQVPIPGATSTPTPAATEATSTPSPSPTTPESAAIEPVPRTADGVLDRTFPVTVGEVPTVIEVPTTVDPAGTVSGTITRVDAITGTEAAPVRAVAEEAATGRIVRSTTAVNGRYTLHGLTPGTRYRVWAVTDPTDPALAQMGDVTATATTRGAAADVLVDRPAVSAAGTVPGATDGTVRIGDDSLFARSVPVSSSGAWAAQGLVPGAYPVVVRTPGRLASDPVGVVVGTAQIAVAAQPGPRPATVKAWFISVGTGVPLVSGTATDADGDVVRFRPTDDGHVTVSGLRPGTYSFDSTGFLGSAATLDGPWFFLAPTGTFSLSDGATTDLQAVVLHLRSR